MPLINVKAKKMFPDKIIRKELSLKNKEKLNLPTYLLENIIYNQQLKNGKSFDFEKIKKYVKDKVVNSKDQKKIQAKIRNKESLVIIDKITAKMYSSKQEYLAQIFNLGIKKAKISQNIINEFPDLLDKGIWAEIEISYLGSQSKKDIEFKIEKVQPLQHISFDLNEYIEKVKQFKTDEWFKLLLRSIGIEPNNSSKRTNLLTLSRLIPFVEKNYNFIELGYRGTGKSYNYRQLSNQSILVSGGKSTVANLFYNLNTKQMGLVGKKDVVAFDEVAYVDFKDKTSIQILKDYMESASFSRGEEEISADASIVFLGNINQKLKHLLRDNDLLKSFSHSLKDLALIDRMHFFLPGWEMNKLKEKNFTKHYGLRNDYLAIALSKLREFDFTHHVENFFDFDTNMDVRDLRAIKKTVSGFIKLLHPDGNYTKNELNLYLDLASEGRKRVKEQLTKMGSFEYERISFEYIDKETNEKHLPKLPEDKLDSEIKQRIAKPGIIYIGQIIEQELALLKLVIKIKPGNGNIYFSQENNFKLVKQIKKSFMNIKGKSFDLKKQMNQNDFYIKIIPIQKKITADISRVFFIALYSLIQNKSLTNGFIVNDKSSLFKRKTKYNVIKAIKVENEDQTKTLLPIKRRNSNIYVEIPREVYEHAPYFLKLV